MEEMHSQMHYLSENKLKDAINIQSDDMIPISLTSDNNQTIMIVIVRFYPDTKL